MNLSELNVSDTYRQIRLWLYWATSNCLTKTIHTQGTTPESIKWLFGLAPWIYDHVKKMKKTKAHICNYSKSFSSKRG